MNDIEIEFRAFMDQTLIYLEYLNYPDMIIEFEPDCVAQSMGRAMVVFYTLGYSHRTCALAVFGITFEQQILPLSKNVTKH